MFKDKICNLTPKITIMKTTKTLKTVLALLFIIPLVIISCKKEIVDNNDNNNSNNTTDITSIKVDNSFNWNTTENISLRIEARSNDNKPLSKIRMNVYDNDPGDGLNNVNMAKIIYSGFTNENGVLSTNLNAATYQTKIYVKPKYIGLEEKVEIPIINGVASYVFGGKISKTTSKGISSPNPIIPMKGKINYFTLGTWNSLGVPSYLTTSDVVSDSLLADINASLPEYYPITQTHPQYLVNGNEANTVLTDSAEVWVTFVHEGAGNKNTWGYYTYHKDTVPTTVNDIHNLTVVFPNSSFYNSGGGLHSGDKVYLGTFPANTVIGYFLIPNGFNSSNATISTNITPFFSNSNLNPESTASLQKHMVMLNDPVRNLQILGFEDINRSKSNCDNDFNDAIFYLTATPYTAVQTTNVPEIDTPVDTDNDGVSDKFDDYPNDPNKALNNYYPSEGNYGTLIFEDLWPNRGDYDFNDLVLDYQFNQVANASNKIVEIDASLVVRAIGAGYHNGFGFQMDLFSSDVSSITGQDLRYNYINLSANGTESGQPKATIIPFDNAFNILPSPGGTFINTIVGQTHVIPDTQNLVITLSSPKFAAEVGYPPYNPFLIANKVRGKEIHLPGYAPTLMADTSLFGTGDDRTNIATANYYKSDNNLPWALDLPSSFVYPKEKSSIILGHLKFVPWAQSNGYSFMDWYEDLPGYRNTTYLYSY